MAELSEESICHRIWLLSLRLGQVPDSPLSGRNLGSKRETPLIGCKDVFFGTGR
jgi:hypothetical protein